MVLAPDGFKDEEYLEPRQVLEKSGIVIKVASLRSGEAHGVKGALAPIDLLATEVKPEDFDAIIFVGGPGMADLVSDGRLIVLAQQFHQAGKLTTAICIAPMILAYAGLLKNKKATVWPRSQEDFIKAGALYTGKAVEIDGRIITADGPGAARKFGETIAGSIFGGLTSKRG